MGLLRWAMKTLRGRPDVRKPKEERCLGCNVKKGRSHLFGCKHRPSERQLPLNLGNATRCPHMTFDAVCPDCRKHLDAKGAP